MERLDSDKFDSVRFFLYWNACKLSNDSLDNEVVGDNKSDSSEESSGNSWLLLYLLFLRSRDTRDFLALFVLVIGRTVAFGSLLIANKLAL